MAASKHWGYFELAPWGFYAKERMTEEWNLHQKRNKHHWQYWVCHNDGGALIVCRMPERYMREMVADWAGAGRAISGRWDLSEWWEKNRERMLFRDEHRVAQLVHDAHERLG